MKLQVMSDLHFEMHADGGAQFIRQLDPTGVDLLVLAAFEKALATHVGNGDIVVTHHLPTPASVPPRFARSAINAFFVSDMTDYVRDLRPKLWIHGHTHDRCDYVIGDTRVIANPFGYPKELRSNEMFEPALHVEI